MEWRCHEAKSSVIEGAAMVGKLTSYNVERCGRGARIRAKLVTGEELCTPCLDPESVELCRRVIELYTRVANLVRR